MTLFRPVLIGAWALILGGPAAAQVRALDSALAATFPPTGPGAAMLVSHHGRVVYRGARGRANISTGQPLTLTTPIYIASLAKQFTAAGIMRLAEQGRLRYSDSLARLLPELGPWTAGVTIEQLLTHTGGIPDYSDSLVDANPGFDNSQAIAWLERTAKLDFIPGTRISYSNAGYVVLARIIERLSGKSLHDFLAAEFFEPLGMRHTGVIDGPHPAPADAARGYTMTNGVPALHESRSRTAGPGGVYSTVEDLYRWDRAYAERRLFSDSTVARASRPAVLASGRPTAYGYGWLAEFPAKGPLANVWYVASTGDLKGFQALMKRIPAREYSVIVLSNAGDFPWNLVELA